MKRDFRLNQSGLGHLTELSYYLALADRMSSTFGTLNLVVDDEVSLPWPHTHWFGACILPCLCTQGLKCRNAPILPLPSSSPVPDFTMWASCCNWFCLDGQSEEAPPPQGARTQAYSNPGYSSFPSPTGSEPSCKACGVHFASTTRKVSAIAP